MKNSTYLIFLLAIGLALVSYKWIYSEATAQVEVASRSTIDDILTRTSVRSYTGVPVDSAQIDTLLRAAMAAPTAVNKQPWRFVVITDRSLLKEISEEFSSMKMAESASLAVVMCGDMEAALPDEAREFWVQDVSAASENLLLAAHAMGLGAVWCGIYPLQERVTEFSEMLRLPQSVIPMACICVGYPSATPAPKDKWNPANIHYNRW
ncbi:MAG: nitroreductase family protein [Muribaculaceae bacterium]|nr:nitroreductase family protein [Muribaculaceae bacterium]